MLLISLISPNTPPKLNLRASQSETAILQFDLNILLGGIKYENQAGSDFG